jgi:2-iminoacetate synthase ThiH
MDAGRRSELEAKVYAGQRLSREDGEALFACDDLAWLGRLAHHRRTELNGDRVTFATDPDPSRELAGESPLAALLPYGKKDDHGQRLDRLIRLRDQQDATGGLVVVVPVLHQPESGDHTETAAPAESLKTFAVARLLVDNVPHVKSLWGNHGLSVAQLTLNFGADDLDGTVTEAGPTREDLLEVIWDAGFRPVERDARYEVVREHEAAPSLAGRRSEPQQVWA